MNIGILDLQGSVIEHQKILAQFSDVNIIKVKYLHQLDIIDGLIIPGGESTAIGKSIRDFQLLKSLKNKINNGLPTWGTCAGLIILAKYVNDKENVHLSVMDINVRRNAYGSQLNSFITSDYIDEISDKPIKMVFIRAPYIINSSSDVKILKKIDNKIIAAKQNNMLVTAFHPELTSDLSVHKYFISMVKKSEYSALLNITI